MVLSSIQKLIHLLKVMLAIFEFRQKTRAGHGKDEEQSTMHSMYYGFRKFVMFNILYRCANKNCYIKFNYLMTRKGKDKIDERIIMSNGRSVEIIYSQNKCLLKATHYTTSPSKFCSLHRYFSFNQNPLENFVFTFQFLIKTNISNKNTTQTKLYME